MAALSQSLIVNNPKSAKQAEREQGASVRGCEVGHRSSTSALVRMQTAEVFFTISYRLPLVVCPTQVDN